MANILLTIFAYLAIGIMSTIGTYTLLMLIYMIADAIQKGKDKENETTKKE